MYMSVLVARSTVMLLGGNIGLMLSEAEAVPSHIIVQHYKMHLSCLLLFFAIPIYSIFHLLVLFMQSGLGVEAP